MTEERKVCPNPDCRNGYIKIPKAKWPKWTTVPCPACQGTGGEPSDALKREALDPINNPSKYLPPEPNRLLSDEKIQKIQMQFTRFPDGITNIAEGKAIAKAQQALKSRPDRDAIAKIIWTEYGNEVGWETSNAFVKKVGLPYRMADQILAFFDEESKEKAEFGLSVHEAAWSQATKEAKSEERERIVGQLENAFLHSSDVPTILAKLKHWWQALKDEE